VKDKNKLIRVFTGNEISAIHLKEELEEIGVSSLIQNDFRSGMVGGFGGGIPSAVDLFIQQSDQIMAQPIINEFIETNKG
jgi:hypothetical protein